MVTVKSFILLFFVCVAQVECGDYVSARKCSTLFSQPNFSGSSFILNDFDQSVDLTREYRQFLNGWTNTGSIRVENGCKITICDGRYFEEDCDSFSNDMPDFQNMAMAKSVNCTCERKCSCEDIYITPDEYNGGVGDIGRAYLKGGCDTCNAEYLKLEGYPPTSDLNSVEAFVLRKGCSIKVSEDTETPDDNRIFIKGPVYKGWNETFAYYTAECKPYESMGPPHQFKTYLPLAELPRTWDALHEMLLLNETLRNHVGVQAALESSRNTRGSRNAYVLFIGSNLGHWTVFPQSAVGWPHALSYTRMERFREFHIPVGVDDLHITSQLRVVWAPIGGGVEAGLEFVDEAIQELDDYLSAHEELSNVLPNAVVVHYQFQPGSIKEDDLQLRKIFKFLSALRSRLIVGNYSNVMFFMERDDGLAYRTDVERNPTAKIAELEKVLINTYGFPTPIAMNINVNPNFVDTSFHFVNGYQKMANGEYWRKSMENSLVNNCEKGGDPLVKAIVKAAFQDNWTPRGSIRSVQDIMGRDRFDFGPEAVAADPSDYDGYCECSTIKVELEQEIEKLKTEVEEIKNISDIRRY